MGIAERLKTTRESRGLNLTQAASELGVARTAYRLWELGAAMPSPQHWRDIATWCAIPFATVLRELGYLDSDEEQELLRLAARREGQEAGSGSVADQQGPSFG